VSVRAFAAALPGLIACVTAHAAGELPVSAQARTATEQAEALMRECRYDEADAVVAAAMKTATPEDRKLLLLTTGMLAENRGDVATALRHYEEATTGEQVPAQALRMLGRAQVANRHFREGHESLMAYVNHEIKVLKRLPSQQDLAALAVAAAELGQLQDGLQLLDLVMQRVSAYDPLVTELRDRIAAAKEGAAPEGGTFWALAYGGEHSIASTTTDFAPQPLKRIAPPYPREAARDGLQGRVVLHLKIDASGNVTDVRVVRSTARVFDAVARKAVRQWKYVPRVRQCRAVPGEGIQTIEFRLED
jgi:TonB family protein